MPQPAHLARVGNDCVFTQDSTVTVEQLEARLLLSQGLCVTTLTPTGGADNPFETVHLTFNQAVQAASFQDADVTVTGPSGEAVAARVTRVDETTYDITLDDANNLGNYSLVLGPDILDQSGHPMDQDHDGTPGEAVQDAYRAKLIAAGATITTLNTASDGWNLTLYGGESTIDGSHSFASLSLLGGAVLTHSADTDSQTYSIDLSIRDGLTIDASSRIDVSAKGYLPNHTDNNTVAATLGGSYGGVGYAYDVNQPGKTYGDYRNPTQPGAGGWGREDWPGVSGGGLVRISAGAAVIDGQIVADGGASTSSYAGSGGGVWLDVGTLAGNGSISADGGSASFSGGGGRVAVYYDGLVGFDLGQVMATGGSQGSGHAGAGTVYLQQTGQNALLRIDNNGQQAGMWTTLGAAGDNEFDEPYVHVSGHGVVVRPEHQMPMHVTDLALTGGATLSSAPSTETEMNWLDLTVAGTLTVDETSSIEVSGLGYLPGRTSGNSVVGAATGESGGSYGGLGGMFLDASFDHYWTPGTPYGDYKNPTEPGSGGGTTGPGGGLARITAATAVIDGRIAANGADGQSGAGSGGGIRLDVGFLSGSGTITANGGGAVQSWSGGGGGGRVAVYYNTLNGFDLSKVQALPGDGDSGYKGSTGTVYLEETGHTGQLRIDGHGAGSDHWTPLGLPGDAQFTVEDLVITGEGVLVAAEHQMPIHAANVTVSGLANLAHRPASWNQTFWLDLSVSGTLTVASDGNIDVSGLGYLPGRSDGNSNLGGTHAGGGSYGGLGYPMQDYATGLVEFGKAYGDYRNPTEPGSGGGDRVDGAGNGGGLVCISAGTAVIDGHIIASGSGTMATGSGGGVWLDVGVLSGNGGISANGGDTTNGSGFTGGGGRVAVYYDTLDGFDLDKVVALGGAPGWSWGTSTAGGVGTVYLQQTGQSGDLIIDSHDSDNNAATPLGTEFDSEFTADNLIISGAGVLVVPNHPMTIRLGSLHLSNNAVMSHLATSEFVQQSLNLVVAGQVTIDVGCSIDVSGMGYLPGYTLGNVHVAPTTAGGSYGGRGGGVSHATYGIAEYPNQLGIGGQWPGLEGVSGGGLLHLTAGSLVLNGTILADGQEQYGGAGGAGGGILVNAGSVSGTGAISASGGAGYNGGGGGRIAVYAWSDMTLPKNNIHTTGGVSTSSGAAGQAGTVVYPTGPQFFWPLAAGQVFHDQELVRWDVLGVDPGTMTVDLEVTDGQAGTTTLVQGADPDAGVLWDTSALADGQWQIHAVFHDEAGIVVGEDTQMVTLFNAVAWHGGEIAEDQTWTADKVHVVTGDITLGSGVTLTIEPGAIVKFAPRAKLILRDGATLNALATSDRPIIMTAMADDTVGGDSDLSGSASVYPQLWSGINASTAASVNLTSYVDIRYVTLQQSGTLSDNAVWTGNCTYYVTSNLTIPAGVSLTILPGAVVKLAPGTSIFVQGSLVAHGLISRPIVFTSDRDDSVGGDTNDDGGTQTPAAGNWKAIDVTGSLDVDYVQVRYGGGGTLNHWFASIRGAELDSTASITVNNSIISDSFFDGIVAIHGTRLTLSNSLLLRNDEGVWAYGVGLGQTITNCTIDGNRVGILVGDGTLVVNCLVTNNRETGIEGDFDGGIIHNTDVWAPADLGSVNYRSIEDRTGQDGNISADPKYRDRDTDDYRLDYLSPAIDAGDGVAATASDLMGAPRFDDPRTLNTGKPAGNDFADMGALEFADEAPSNVDLIVSNVSGPAAAVVGDTAVVQWTVTNMGTVPITGPWHDSVYLSLGGKDNPSAAFLAAQPLVGEGIVLQPGQSVQFMADITVPAGYEGANVWEVTTNSRADVFEGQNRQNNTSDSSLAVNLSYPELTVDSPAFQGQFTASGQSRWFVVHPDHDGQDILVNLALGGPGLTELYVQAGRPVRRDAYNLAATQAQGSQRVQITDAQQGVAYYVLAYASSASGTGDFSLAATTPVYGIESVSPSQGGNVGNVTVAISGSEIPQGVLAVLIGPDGTKYYGGNLYYVDPTQAYVTFDLAGAVANAYDLRLIAPDGSTTTKAGAFQIVAGHGPSLQANVIIPSVIRAGRPYSFQIEYSNTGDTDLISPVLRLTTSDKRALGMQSGRVDGSGELDFLGYSSTGPAGILRPGEVQCVTVYSTAAIGSDNTVQYLLTSQWVDPLHPRYDAINWNTLANNYGGGAALNTVGFWETFTTQMGGTWDSLYAKLANILTQQVQSGMEPDSVVSRLMQSAVALASQRGGGLTDTELPSILSVIPYDGNGLQFVDVIFSKTIDASTFTAADVTITAPDGAAVTPVVTSLDGRVYTISFQVDGKNAFLKTKGNYVFAIGPDIADANGLALDQDRDGQSGEVVDDVFTTSFYIQTNKLVSPILHVVGQSPSGRVDAATGVGLSSDAGQNPALPGPYTPGVDHLTLQFSRAVQFLTFRPQDVTVRAPDGAAVPVTGVRQISSTIWQVDFVRQTAYGQYTVKVGTALRDEEGYNLDQNLNGISDEGDQDMYTGTFTLVDVHGPSVVAQSPDDYILDATGVVDVTFDEAIDPATFGVGDVTFTGPSGPVAVSSITPLDERTYRIQLAAPLAVQGEYQLTVGPNVTDLAGNAMDQDQDGVKGRLSDTYTGTVRLVVDPQSTVQVDPPEVGAADQGGGGGGAAQAALQGPQGDDPIDEVVITGTVTYSNILATFFSVPHVKVQLWEAYGLKDRKPGIISNGDSEADVMVSSTNVLTGTSDLDAKGQFVFNATAAGNPLLKQETKDGVPVVPVFYVIVIAENGSATTYDATTARASNPGSPLWQQLKPDGSHALWFQKALVQSSSWMPGPDQPGLYTQVHNINVQVNSDLFTPTEWIRFAARRLSADFNVSSRTAIPVVGNYSDNPEEAYYMPSYDLIALGSSQTRYPAAILHEYGHSIQNYLNGFQGLADTAHPSTGAAPGGGTFDTWYGIIQESSEFVRAAGADTDTIPAVYHADKAYREAWASFVAAYTLRGQEIWGLGINDDTDYARSVAMFLNNNNWWMGFDAYGFNKDMDAGDDSVDPGLLAATWDEAGKGINKNASTGDVDLGGVLTAFWKIANSGPNGQRDLWNAFKAACAPGSNMQTFWNALPHTRAYETILIDNGIPLMDGSKAVDDEYEGNDTIETAADITPVTDVAGEPLGPITLNGLVMAERNAGAGDWYKFDVVGDQYAPEDKTRTVTIQLDWDTTYGYLDIYAENTTTVMSQQSILKRDRSGHILLSFPDLKAAEDYSFVVDVAGYGALNTDGTASAFGGDYVPDYSLVINWGGVPTPDDDDGPKPPPPPPYTWPQPQDDDDNTEGAAHDPNALVGPSGVGTDAYVTAGMLMPYSVLFENSGPQATLPAQEVRITNQLDTGLDWSTFALTEINFGSHTITVPQANGQYFHTTYDLRPGQNIVVDIEAGINQATGEVYCNFRSLDPATGELTQDPMAGFLPVNDLNHSGEGYVSYVVNQAANLPTGRQIVNQASIVFDTNAPMTTNTALNTVDAGGPVSGVATASGSMGVDRIDLNWSAVDAGSGLGHVELYASDNGGAYALAYDGTGYGYSYATQPGHTYRFYTVAVDAVGYRESVPAQADAQITIWSIASQTLQGKTNKLSFTDTDGTPVTITYSGTGSALVERWDNPANHQGDIRAITITNPDGKGTLTVTTKGKGQAAATGVGSITVHSSLKAITAKTTSLLGDLTVEGTLGNLAMDDAVSGSTVTIGPRPGGDIKTATSVTFDRLADLHIVSGTPMAALTAVEWLDHDQTADVLEAPSLGKLTIKGDKARLLPGDFEAGLSLSGVGVAAKKPTLGPVSIAGSLRGATWDITGSMGALTVGGTAGGWAASQGVTVKTTGSIGALTLGGANHADFLAGIAPAAAGDATITRRADDVADFTNAQAAITSVTIKAAKGALGQLFLNSNFSAAVIGSVVLVNAGFNNDQAGLTNTQDDFGFWAKAIKSVKHTDVLSPKDKAKNWTWKPGTPLPSILDDMRIQPLI